MSVNKLLTALVW